MGFDLQDNWADVPAYRPENLAWIMFDPPRADGVIYSSMVNGEEWLIRMNDFPDEPLYTLVVDGRDVIHFNDWPSEWRRPE